MHEYLDTRYIRLERAKNWCNFIAFMASVRLGALPVGGTIRTGGRDSKLRGSNVGCLSRRWTLVSVVSENGVAIVAKRNAYVRLRVTNCG